MLTGQREEAGVLQAEDQAQRVQLGGARAQGDGGGRAVREDAGEVGGDGPERPPGHIRGLRF